MEALVIGGTRFVGLRLVRLLVRQGHHITILNRGKTSVQLPEGVSRLYADRRDPVATKTALKGRRFDAVFDMTGYQVANLEPMVEIFNGNIERYVFQSTCAVYADSEVFPVTEDFPSLRRSPGIKSADAYGQDKADCEIFLLKAHKERGFPVTILRCPIIYGPENWMDDREGSYFARFLTGRQILIAANGSAINHFAHVDDVARAHISLIGKEQTLGEVYNICEAQAITINGYVDTIAQITGIQSRKIYLEPQELRKMSRSIFPFAWTRNSLYGIQKAREHFDFWPEFDLKKGMENTYKWWVEEKGLEKISFIPGRLGHDVDLAFEDELIKKMNQ